MAVTPIILHLLVFFILLGLIILFFMVGRKSKKIGHKVLSYSSYTLCVLTTAILWLCGLIETSDSNNDVLPTLIVINEDGERIDKKIIGFSYKGKKIKYKLSGSYYVENLTEDNYIAYHVYFRFYGSNSSRHQEPAPIPIPPHSIVDVLSNKPIGPVDEIPWSRTFVTRGRNPGDGRSVTYIMKEM